MKSLINNRMMWVLIYSLSFAVSLYLSSRHSFLWSGDADAANSPLVWRALLDRGWDVFNQWQPTFDNWYLTVYPVNFILFFLMGDDGLQPLILSSAIFIFIISICVTEIVRENSNRSYALISLILITFISPDLYRNGYLSHPFSHNSTNAYGFVIFVTYIYSIKKNGIAAPIICSLLSLTSSVSDPWLLASFFLPMLITELSLVICDRRPKRNLIIFIIFFIVAASNIVQKVLGLPVHAFELASAQVMIENLKLSALLTAKILPISYIKNDPLSYLIFITWVITALYAAWACIKFGGVVKYVAIFSILSVMGIYSSSIVGDQTPHQRFYLNIVPMLVILCAIASSLNKKLLFLAPFALSFITCIYGYSLNKIQYKLNDNPVNEYITFLQSHDLHYGYGSFWGMTMGVNWLSNGEVHITPVYFDKRTGLVNFKDARVQTMRFWHSADFIKRKPNRQFIALRKGVSGDQCSDIEFCAKAIEKQVGKPDETLDFDGLYIMVYNHKIQTGL